VNTVILSWAWFSIPSVQHTWNRLPAIRVESTVVWNQHGLSTKTTIGLDDVAAMQDKEKRTTVNISPIDNFWSWSIFNVWCIVLLCSINLCYVMCRNELHLNVDSTSRKCRPGWEWWCLPKLRMCAPYRLWGGNALWFMCWFWRYINCLFACLLNFLPHFLPLIFSFPMFLSYLSKPAKQVWYWALRVYWDQFRVYVCMYICMYVCVYVCMYVCMYV